MDLVSDILRSIRLEGSVFFHSRLTAPWGMELSAASEPRFHIILEGHSWLNSDTMDEPIRLNAGSAVLLRDGDTHWIADDPSSSRVASAEAGEAYLRGEPMFQGTRTDCNLICGRLSFDKELHHPLIETIPDVVVLNNHNGAELPWVKRTGGYMEEELISHRPGSSVVVDRLCELFLIQVLRNLKVIDPHPVTFVTALDDPHISKALELIHTAYFKNLTLEEMAQAAGLSRSAFAKRFHVLVGYPPKTYLTTWRMHKAKGLLGNPYMLLNQIAIKVGYSSDIAFIRAFKRFFGKSPKHVRNEIIEQGATRYV